MLSQSGQFEWNDIFSPTCRLMWRASPHTIPCFVSRLKHLSRAKRKLRFVIVSGTSSGLSVKGVRVKALFSVRAGFLHQPGGPLCVCFHAWVGARRRCVHHRSCDGVLQLRMRWLSCPRGSFSPTGAWLGRCQLEWADCGLGVMWLTHTKTSLC